MVETTSEGVIGVSHHSAEIRRFIDTAAASSLPVLVLGEPGVGKELVARNVHACSARNDGPFLMIDCSLYYERELARELFGARGAGPAARSRQGLLEFATRGTCYLARVEELSPALQLELLAFLLSGRFHRLGDAKEVQSRARLIASSDKNLAGFVEGGLFSEELYRELSRLSLALLPLRERAADVDPLVRFFAEGYSLHEGRLQVPSFTAGAIRALKAYPWPRNVDELKEEVLRLVRGGREEVHEGALSFEVCSFWEGHSGNPEIRMVLEELNGYIREFTVLSRLEAEFGEILLDLDPWPMVTRYRRWPEELEDW